MSNVEVVAFLTLHGVDFEHWPHGLLPPAASAYLQEVARTSFDERHEETLLGTEDILVLDEYLASCERWPHLIGQKLAGLKWTLLMMGFAHSPMLPVA